MELINQHTKKVMEGCKERAREAGLSFTDESLEYIVTNRDLLELQPKGMIPTLYDYWVHDVEVLREKGKYELYPHNPYETVINTRPPISYYNDNNPDWLNVMIFYHVIGHIDFFQNNLFFKHTWDYDFTGKALSDKRLMARLRSRHGRWVDYIIEFARGIDNLVGYHAELSRLNGGPAHTPPSKLDFYFDVFLQKGQEASISVYLKEIERFNQCIKDHSPNCEIEFMREVQKQHPEFEAAYNNYLEEHREPPLDLAQYLLLNSQFVNQESNQWMKAVMEVVRDTSLFFQPQIRTKIMNEGWASYWHQKLFLLDDRIKGHEVDYARTNAYVTSLPRIGLNPYALGMRLFEYITELADKGRLSDEYQRLRDIRARSRFDRQTGAGGSYIFQVREDYCDFTFINQFLDQDFIDRHSLFVSGKRLNRAKQVWEHFVQSRRAEDYRRMLIEKLYHPPLIEVDQDKSQHGKLYLNHRFEGKPLVSDFISGTMLGIEYLWGAPVQLETSEPTPLAPEEVEQYLAAKAEGQDPAEKTIWQRVLYTMRDRKLSRTVLEQGNAA